MSANNLLQNFKWTPVDQMGVDDRIARIKSRSIKDQTKIQGLKMALNMIDLTTLEGADTPNKVSQMCYKAMHPHDSMLGLPTVAAVCVYPTLVKTAKKALRGSNVKVAAVATYFPSGQTNLQAKLDETHYAIGEGADEIDMVISRGKFLQGEYNYVLDEIIAVKEICHASNVRLKVILETGELGSVDEVRKASDLALQANPDFIKTSTGKIGQAATMPVTLVMLQAIWDHFQKTGIRVGMKPAGGISDAKSALHYLLMVKEVLGEEWLTNEWFRFGASRLANDILMQLAKQESGMYQAGQYFSKD
ncbi:MAG: deoxyribose-phosphate aldolase [Salibacteraceae bacterium]|jgi:deoxyribose-phosphate aldolase|nr:deoxyribose-phosphate aldolase [Salibacteraceae bacterium]MDP4687734.1 deoxyribose-phosphate aldolase [Salibacteraceae bacterium]MDP4762352.1 deoxyribose-phosphate aldolase [Salibacteraceae bacterium]MDP4845098.1 deoxyribose-phosphate aldolase [Salibacteraceae bacterium]MDP4934236.1 deoxyribose-phosphate aldolase [Salibacteraceae bacterium]